MKSQPSPTSILLTKGNFWRQLTFQKSQKLKKILNANFYMLIISKMIKTCQFDQMAEKQLGINPFFENIYEKEEETENPRAGYVALKYPVNSKKKIEIFTKTGEATSYHKFIQTQKPRGGAETKTKKNISKKRRNSSDDQYNVKNQKKDRNVTSNLVHHLVKYLTTSKSLQEEVTRMISSRNLRITFGQFQQNLLTQTKNLKTYVTIKHIKDLWFNQKPDKLQFSYIMRVLSRSFYRRNGFLSIYYSNKFNRASKNVHYKGIRNLIEVLMKKDIEQLTYSLMTP